MFLSDFVRLLDAHPLLLRDELWLMLVWIYFIVGCCGQVRQEIKTIRRIRRSVDRMSEEKKVLREAEVAKEKESSFSIHRSKSSQTTSARTWWERTQKSNPHKSVPSRQVLIPSFSLVRLPFDKSHTSQVLTLARVTQGVLCLSSKEEGKHR